MLLVGDAIERSILPRLTPARRRILKVAHHGSGTSTSRELLEQWRPQIGIISCGRGNTFGDPTPEILQRLNSVGATIYRTDRDGQVTVETDGQRVCIRTYRQRHTELVAPSGAGPPLAGYVPSGLLPGFLDPLPFVFHLLQRCVL